MGIASELMTINLKSSDVCNFKEGKRRFSKK
jgi:hypothetical protein